MYSLASIVTPQSYLLCNLASAEIVSNRWRHLFRFSLEICIIFYAASSLSYSRKEVFQPHLPVRLPCYDLAPVTSFTLGGSLRLPTLGTPSFHGLTGGVYKVRERIHRSVADLRLLAIPASWGRVADPNPN